MAEDVRTIIATDCGSTTTKAILIEKQGPEYRLVVRGEAPTTVEAPFDDVTVGVLNAVREVEELSGKTLIGENGKIITRLSLDDRRPTADDNSAGSRQSAVSNPNDPTTQRPNDPNSGVDLYLSTSSAGGGLQMTVAGVVKAMSAESANRAALGAGAIVMDTMAVD